MVSEKKTDREKSTGAKVCLPGTWVRKQQHDGKQRGTERQTLLRWVKSRLVVISETTWGSAVGLLA